MHTRVAQTVAALIAGIAACGVAEAQTMYRCTAPGGALSFQQTPCAPGQQGRELELRQVPVTTMADNIRALSARNARGDLTEDDLLRRYGQPTVVNTDIIGGSVRRQLVYRFPNGRTQYYYSEDGVITALQDRPRPPHRLR